MRHVGCESSHHHEEHVRERMATIVSEAGTIVGKVTSHFASLGAVPCLVDTLTLAQNGPENARDHHAEEHLHR